MRKLACATAFFLLSFFPVGGGSVGAAQPEKTPTEAQRAYDEATKAYERGTLPDLERAQQLFIKAHELKLKGQALEEDCARWSEGRGVEPSPERAKECGGPDYDPNQEDFSESAVSEEICEGDARAEPRCILYKESLAEGRAKRLMLALNAKLDPAARAAFADYVVALNAFFQQRWHYRSAISFAIDRMGFGAQMYINPIVDWPQVEAGLKNIPEYRVDPNTVPEDLPGAQAEVKKDYDDQVQFLKKSKENRKDLIETLAAAQRDWATYRDASVRLFKAVHGRKQDPGKIELDVVLGETLGWSGEMELAQRALTYDPDEKAPVLDSDPSEEGVFAYQKGDFAKALGLLKPLAEKGNTIAQNYLGLLYRNGRGVPKDDALALGWFRKSADQGQALGQSSLGFMYQNGRGVPKDEAAAAAWYRKAADQGLAPAQAALGFLYQYGKGVPKDDGAALDSYRKAAVQGYAPAQDNLAFMYQNGKGVAQDEGYAAAWYRRAADQGYAYAQATLAHLYQTGRGVPQDAVQAYEWYALAALHFAESDKANRESAGKSRDAVAAKLTAAQRSAGQTFVKAWKPKEGGGQP